MRPVRSFLVIVLAGASACGGGEDLEVREAPTPEGTTPPARAESPPPLPPRPERIERPGGLVIEIREPGDGLRGAAAGDRLTLHYTVRLAADGREVESTRVNGIPYTLTLGAGEVVRGLDRGLLGARAGDRLVVHVPAAEAYGTRGLGDVPPNADLTFDVRVLRVERP